MQAQAKGLGQEGEWGHVSAFRAIRVRTDVHAALAIVRAASGAYECIHVAELTDLMSHTVESWLETHVHMKCKEHKKHYKNEVKKWPFIKKTI